MLYIVQELAVISLLVGAGLLIIAYNISKN